MEHDPQTLYDLAAYLDLRRAAETFLAERPALQRLLLEIHRHWPPHVASHENAGGFAAERAEEWGGNAWVTGQVGPVALPPR